MNYRESLKLQLGECGNEDKILLQFRDDQNLSLSTRGVLSPFPKPLHLEFAKAGVQEEARAEGADNERRVRGESEESEGESGAGAE